MSNYRRITIRLTADQFDTMATRGQVAPQVREAVNAYLPPPPGLSARRFKIPARAGPDALAVNVPFDLLQEIEGYINPGTGGFPQFILAIKRVQKALSLNLYEAKWIVDEMRGLPHY